ncbi:hypothetical protein niasHT_029219 [Heterodera trifolii]|uniref:Uncharacterized protein n=1 Tax=Heterodera trifolii TaxID=157864 RepID=A0ABD2JEB1_9BILA
MITIATDACYRLPSKELAYIECVQFLLYYHLQKLVWLLENKYGAYVVNKSSNANFDNASSLMQTYAEKKMQAWGAMVDKYAHGQLSDLGQIAERIRMKFSFCLVIEGKTQLECSAISVENADIFVKDFHEIIFAPKFERKRSLQAEIIAINIVNSLREKRRVAERVEIEQEKDEEKRKKAIMASRNWKLAVPSMRVRVQVLVNMAETKCRKLIKSHYKFVSSKNKQKVEEAKGKKKLKQESINQNDKKDKMKKDIDNNKEQNLNEGEKKDPPMTENYTKRLDELKNDFSICIYHYMYAFSQNLIKRIEVINGENSYNKELKDIYKNLRQKTRKRMESVYNSEGLENMDKWLNGEKGPSESTAKKGEDEDENEEETWEDPFNDCANVVKDHVEDSMLNGGGGLMDKSFDEYLFDCAGQFFEAVAGDKFNYILFINLYTMQLDTSMEFPESMKENTNRKTANNKQVTKDKCFMMRELLITLNKNLAHRLNYEKITSRDEKEEFVSLVETHGDLQIKLFDDRNIEGKKRDIIKEALQEFRLHNTFGTLLHPIRDQYRIGREYLGQKLEPIMDYVGQKIEPVMDYVGQKIEPVVDKCRGAKEVVVKKIEPIMETCREGVEYTVEKINELTPKKRGKTLKELIKEDKQLEEKIEETKKKIQDNPLIKRLEAYKMFFRAFYIALAIELFERMPNERMQNWQFMLRSDDTEQTKTVNENDKVNIAKIKEQREVFDEIVTRMGHSMKKQSDITLNLKFWEKTAKEKQHEGNESPENEADKEIGIGHELRFMGYVMESNGEELRVTLKNEMQLNLEQFNMSFDDQCDLTSDLTECFAASDGLDYAAQLEKASFTGKTISEMNQFERGAEKLFKKLNRWSYKFGQKEKHRQNLMNRFFIRLAREFTGVVPKVMTNQTSFGELLIPFYVPAKKGVKFLVVKSVTKFRTFVVYLFSTVNWFVNSAKSKHNEFMEDEPKGEREEISEEKLLEMGPLIEFPNEPSLSKNLMEILGILKTDDEIERQKNVKKEKRRRRRGFGSEGGLGKGGGITQYRAAGKHGSPTIKALLINGKMVKFAITDPPISFVHLHWLTFHHEVNLGLIHPDLGGSVLNYIVVIYVVVSVCYWFEAWKLMVNMASLYGDLAGWTIFVLALAFYICFSWLFVIL